MLRSFRMRGAKSRCHSILTCVFRETGGRECMYGEGATAGSCMLLNGSSSKLVT